MGSQSEFLNFILLEKKPKTKVWGVDASLAGYRLGLIHWHAPWRKYCFFPHRDTIYEQTCLREIAFFIEHETMKRKAERKAERKAKKELLSALVESGIRTDNTLY